MRKYPVLIAALSLCWTCLAGDNGIVVKQFKPFCER